MLLSNSIIDSSASYFEKLAGRSNRIPARTMSKHTQTTHRHRIAGEVVKILRDGKIRLDTASRLRYPWLAGGEWFPALRTEDTMATYYYHSECGHEQGVADHWKTGPAIVIPRSTCAHCKRARIGKTITFLRFGKPPAQSRNHRDGTIEAGVSVYEIKNGKAQLEGWHYGFLNRPAFIGTGKICGWGSDGEPVVQILTIRKCSAKQASDLVA